MQAGQPLTGIRVLDFSTLLPGPMCSLLLAEAGATVIKIEKPPGGDEMRGYDPKLGRDSVNFGLLNRGKKSLALDLKSHEGRCTALNLVREADVLIEQFRPGVMDRLGLGYDVVADIGPHVIYCSISGYGQSGPLSQVAAHDLNFAAEVGMLGLVANADRGPTLPPALIADIGGGAYPAVMNILLALMQRERSGRGCRLDIAMADNLFPFMYWALGNGWAAGEWPSAGSDLLTGGSPRYNIYRAADGQFLAVAALEQKFWENFLRVIDAMHLLDDSVDSAGTIAGVAARISTEPASTWEVRFHGVDACVSIVRSLREAMAHPHFAGRGLFRHVLVQGGKRVPALPVPIDQRFRRAVGEELASPVLDEQ